VFRRSAYVLGGCLALAACGGRLASPDLTSNPVTGQPISHPAGALLKKRVLYSFAGGRDGSFPVAGLISDASGALYGTTSAGGGTGCGGSGCGTVFKLTPAGARYTESIIHIFTGKSDGQIPLAGLIADASGAFYGTTEEGGTGGSACPAPPTGCGTVFKLTPSGSRYTESVLYSFRAGTDGAYPYDRVVIGRHNALYGTTTQGGQYGEGTVFKIKTSGAGYEILYSFRGGDDGNDPVSAVLPGPKGVLFGTTVAGGTQKNCNSQGCGIVYELVPSGHGYSEGIVHNFAGGTRDGQYPESDLTIDKVGALYGMTYTGGSGPCTSANPPGCGTTFKLVPSGSAYEESLLYSFQGGTDAQYLSTGSRLVVDPSHKDTFYSLSRSGGGSNACTLGCGTIFMFRPNGSTYSESVLYRFSGTGGYYPNGALLVKGRRLLGTTLLGGKDASGVIFEARR
jgi:uncharacterized repeat protein (TIGR03803 family)